MLGDDKESVEAGDGFAAFEEAHRRAVEAADFREPFLGEIFLLAGCADALA